MTTLTSRGVAVPPDPIAVARRLHLAGLADVTLLHSAESRGVSWVAAEPDALSQRLDPLQEDDGEPASGPLAAAPRWIGVVPYEARRELERPDWSGADEREAPLLLRPEWRRYRSVVRIDAAAGRVDAIGEERGDVVRLARLVEISGDPGSDDDSPDMRCTVSDDDPADEHLERVRRALRLIHDGDLYQVNLARRLAVRLERGEPLALYQRLVRAAPCAFGAALSLGRGRHVLSTSPELLLRAEARRPNGGGWPGLGLVHSEPIKGTRPRGADSPSDRALSCELDADPKERAELSMIIDVVRNDLSRVCELGSVRVAQAPRVVTHRTIHHRKARLVGLCRAGIDREEVLAALVPSGSVTGAPKVRAMEVIADLERHRRGLYTGAFGYVGHDGGVTLAMAIRVLVLEGGSDDGYRGHYWTGGGIVAASDPAAELRETDWKALQLFAAAR